MPFSLRCVVSLATLPSCLLPLRQVKEKERRLRVRAQKLEDQRLQQELRLRRMQERAQGGPKIRVSSAASVGVETQGGCISNFSPSLSLSLSFPLPLFLPPFSLSPPPPLLPQMGRKLVYRSEPPVLKRKQKESKAQREKEEEEMQYFFS